MLQPAPVQQYYNRYLTSGQNGMPATSTGWDIDTRICEDYSGNGIGFGLVGSQGLSTDRAAVLGAHGGTQALGITVSDITLPNVVSPGPDRYQNTDNMAVAVRGDFWVTAATNVTAGSPVYFDPSTGQLGDTGTLLEGAMWMTSATIGQLAFGAQTESPNLAVVRLALNTGNVNT